MYHFLSLAKCVQLCSQDTAQTRYRPFPSPQKILLCSASLPGNHCSDFCSLPFSFTPASAVDHNHMSSKVLFLDSFQIILWTSFHDVHNCPWFMLCSFIFLQAFIYLFLERGEEREKERNRNISVWLPLTRPLLGTCLQPRHVPSLGIEPVTFQFIGRHSVHWATPARDQQWIFLRYFLVDLQDKLVQHGITGSMVCVYFSFRHFTL